jgi:hypothetical protein
LSQLLSLGMCVAGLPVARVPSWQEKQEPKTCAWSTRVAGFQALVAWHAPQASLDAMWLPGRPVAVVPLWQDAQLPLTWAWSTLSAGRQFVVAWQLSQLLLARMCVALLPVARVPSWQVAQLFVTPACEKLAGFQAEVTWHDWQSLPDATWSTVLPVAFVPS